MMPVQVQQMAVTIESLTAPHTEATGEMRMAGQATTGTVLTGTAIGIRIESVNIVAAAGTGIAKDAAVSVQRTEIGVGTVVGVQGAPQATGHPLPPCWTSLREGASTRAKSVG